MGYVASHLILIKICTRNFKLNVTFVTLVKKGCKIASSHFEIQFFGNSGVNLT